MAAQGGIRDKILRVSMPFGKRKYLTGETSVGGLAKHLPIRRASDPWSVVLKVQTWAGQLKEGRVASCAEIARREGITPARVSQLWPLSEITRGQADKAMAESNGRELSLRRLIRVARNPDVK
jgi:hypothetical protein